MAKVRLEAPKWGSMAAPTRLARDQRSATSSGARSAKRFTTRRVMIRTCPGTTGLRLTRPRLSADAQNTCEAGIESGPNACEAASTSPDCIGRDIARGRERGRREVRREVEASAENAADATARIAHCRRREAKVLVPESPSLFVRPSKVSRNAARGNPHRPVHFATCSTAMRLVAAFVVALVALVAAPAAGMHPGSASRGVANVASSAANPISLSSSARCTPPRLLAPCVVCPAAVPSSCYGPAEAAKLPPSIFECT